MANDADRRPGDDGGEVIDDEAASKGGYGERSLPDAGSADTARRQVETLDSSPSPPPERTGGGAEPGDPDRD